MRIFEMIGLRRFGGDLKAGFSIAIGAGLSMAITVGLGACSTPCELAPAGVSDIDLVVSEGLGTSGQLQGVYRLTLTPSVARSNCADARELPTEQYGYTLEVKDDGGDEPRIQIYIDGYPFVQDASYFGDQLIYQTEERVEEREGGTVTYRISGSGTFSADEFAGNLLWNGTETIQILESTDDGVFPGCVFEYDVAGAKVCDE